MPRVLLYCLLLILSLSGSFRLQAQIAEPGVPPSTIPLAYWPNHGQWPAQVRLRADVAPGLTLFAEQQRLTWLRYDAAAWAACAHAATEGGRPLVPVPAHCWSVEFVGGAATVQPKPEGEAIGPPRNYFLGADPARWASAVRASPAVRYANLWQGIDLKLHGTSAGDYEYDLLIRAGADPHRIGLRYQGLAGAWLDPLTGALHLRTALGELTEAAPVAWHPAAGTQTRQALACRFTLRQDADGAATVGFELPAGYDRSRPVVLDPVLVFATYSGSTAPVWGHTATYDVSGHLYAAGPCFDPGYPVTTGAFDLTHSNSTAQNVFTNPDVAISRYSADGHDLLYATYLGGSADERPHSLLVNPRGELLVLGTTYSTGFPTTAGAYQTSPMGGSDLFVACFDSTGARLLACTRLGGGANDGFPADGVPNALGFFYGDHYRGDLATDSVGRVFVASATQSGNFPFTTGSPRPPAGFKSSAVVARLSANLQQLEWAAGLGFNAVAYGLYLPRDGAPYVVGTTSSASFPTTPGTLSPTDVGSTGMTQRDGFITQLAPDGRSLRASTYLRPPGTPNAALATQTFFVQPDPIGSDVYILGSSTGSFPRTAGTWGQPNGGLLMERLSGDLIQRRWTTTIGRPVTPTGSAVAAFTDNLSPTAFLVDQCGMLYFSAWGTTTGLPTTAGAPQPQTDGQDLYLASLDPDARGLKFATFLGGNAGPSPGEHVDGGTSRFDPRGRVYQAVCTNALDFPTTPTAWQPAYRVRNGQYDEVAFKFDFEPRRVRAAALATAAPGGPATTTFESPANVQFANASTNYPGTVYQWTFGDGSPLSQAFAPSHLYVVPGVYTITLVALDPGACGGADTTQLLITITANDSLEALAYTICLGDSVRFAGVSLQPGTFRWSPATGLSEATVADPWASPVVTTTYQATGRLLNSPNRTTWRVTVTVLPPDSARLTFTQQCQPEGIAVSFRLSSPITAAVWEFGDGTPLLTLPGTSAGAAHFYTHQPPGRIYRARVAGFDSHTCPISAEVSIGTDALFVPNIITPDGDGLNDTFQVGCAAPGTISLQIYNRWGRLVYDSGENQYVNQWGASGLPGGVYYYYLRLTEAPAVYKGWVEVVK